MPIYSVVPVKHIGVDDRTNCRPMHTFLDDDDDGDDDDVYIYRHVSIQMMLDAPKGSL